MKRVEGKIKPFFEHNPHAKCIPTKEVNKTLLKIMERIEQLEIAFLLLKKQRSEQWTD